MTALNWLTANNPLYIDIQIDCGNIDVQLTGMTHNENYDTTLLTNRPPTNHSSTTTVKENRAEPYNMLTSSEVPVNSLHLVSCGLCKPRLIFSYDWPH